MIKNKTIEDKIVDSLYQIRNCSSDIADMTDDYIKTISKNKDDAIDYNKMQVNLETMEAALTKAFQIFNRLDY